MRHEGIGGGLLELTEVSLEDGLMVGGPDTSHGWGRVDGWVA